MRTYNADPSRYETMPYRRCGESGLLLPPLSLGLWQHCYDIQLTRGLVTTAFDHGVHFDPTHFDLANNYGPPPGAAEEAFGQVLANEMAAYRDEIIISTKAGYDMWPGPYGNWGSRKYLRSSLDQSLKRMRLDYVDVFYHHRPDPHTPLEETISALADIVRSGKAVYAGISNYTGDRIVEAVVLAKKYQLPLIMNQVRYNAFDRGAEQDVLPQCSEHGLGVVAFSPLAQGLLTDRYLNGVPDDSRAAKKLFGLDQRVTPENIEKVAALKGIADERKQSVAGLALSWILRQQQVATVLVGASRVGQLTDSLQACHAAPLSADDIQRIANVLGAD